MTIDQIRKAAQADPFIPFRLSLGNGRKFNIARPDLIMVPREATRIVIAEAPDLYSVIDALLIVSLDFKKRGTRGRLNGGSNGKHRPS